MPKARNRSGPAFGLSRSAVFGQASLPPAASRRRIKSTISIRIAISRTDFSEQSEAAFRFAAALARDYGARLVLTHVLSTPVVMYAEGIVVPLPDDTMNNRKDFRLIPLDNFAESRFVARLGTLHQRAFRGVLIIHLGFRRNLAAEPGKW